mmetsp:Transcript_5640/g.15908  ORF Transcript_5640/g.15908 Transcript_5640/m.15908 type:complete len:297 (+) Transcript_5640:3-893(+)
MAAALSQRNVLLPLRRLGGTISRPWQSCADNPPSAWTGPSIARETLDSTSRCSQPDWWPFSATRAKARLGQSSVCTGCRTTSCSRAATGQFSAEAGEAPTQKAQSTAWRHSRSCSSRMRPRCWCASAKAVPQIRLGVALRWRHTSGPTLRKASCAAGLRAPPLLPVPTSSSWTTGYRRARSLRYAEVPSPPNRLVASATFALGTCQLSLPPANAPGPQQPRRKSACFTQYLQSTARRPTRRRTTTSSTVAPRWPRQLAWASSRLVACCTACGSAWSQIRASARSCSTCSTSLTIRS